MRGISAVLATVLIVIIVVALVGLTYSFSIALFGITTGAGEKATERIATGLSSQARVEFMSINDVIIRNTGLTNLSNFTVFINGEQADFTVDPSVIEPEKLGTITITDFIKEGDEIMILASQGATITKRAPDPCKEAVLCLDMDEGSGNITYDKSGFTGNDGIFYGESFNDGTLKDGNTTNADGDTPPQRVDGQYGSALSFDGIDDYVNFGNVLNTGTGDFTVTFWVKSSSLADQVVFSKKRNIWTSSSGWSFRSPSGSDKLQIWISNGTTQTGLTSAKIVFDGLWNHIAVVFNRSGDAVMYVNSVFDVKVNISLIKNIDTTVPLLIGMETESLEPNKPIFRPFNGTIDEVRIYDRALSEEEIQAEMQSSIPIERPVGAWGFEETGEYANDTHIWVKGKYGKALSFDGIDDYVNISDSTSLDLSDKMTIELWVYNRNLSDVKGWVVKEGAYFFSYASGQITCKFYNTSDEWGFLGWTGYVLSLNKWYHLACSYDASTGDIKVYVDGTNIFNETGYGIIRQSNFNLEIGAYAQSPNRFLNGTIDEVRIYNKAIY